MKFWNKVSRKWNDTQTHIVKLVIVAETGAVKTNQSRLVSNYQLNAQFLYSVIIYMLHYDPQHVSSSTMLIFRGTKLYHYNIWYCHSL